MIRNVLERVKKQAPITYYRLKGIKRRFFEQKMNQLGIEEIKRRNDELYFARFGRHINWASPEAYTEKMQVEKILHNYPLKSQLTDKYEVRKWVAERIGETYLVPLCGKGVYETSSDINFSALPRGFVIKTTSGSGDAIIVKDKSLLSMKDIRRIRAEMDYRLKCNYAWNAYELHYSDIKPRIIIEQLLECDEDDLPDYKFMCFDGTPYFCCVDKDRYHGHKRNVYDLEWNMMQGWRMKYYPNYPYPIKKPKNFEKMVGIATVLSKGFQQIRVDLYNIDGKVYFGELTFTDGAGFSPFAPEAVECLLGKLWNLRI